MTMSLSRMHGVSGADAVVKPPLEWTLIFRRRKDVRMKLEQRYPDGLRTYKLQSVQHIPGAYHALYYLQVKQ